MRSRHGIGITVRTGAMLSGTMRIRAVLSRTMIIGSMLNRGVPGAERGLGLILRVQLGNGGCRRGIR